LYNELGALTNSFNPGTIVTRFAVVSASETVAIVVSKGSRLGFSPAATVDLTLVLVNAPPRITFARCYALLRMRPLSNSWAECSVVISCRKVDYDKSG
jgi:hypothetical protein